ncbi:MAG: Gfo/Idh/MocA family oxidoreductase [Verrucomicrobiota bacterium]
MNFNRRKFLAATPLAAGAMWLNPLPLRAAQPAAVPTAPAITRKIKIGQVGCGGRGSWISKLFAKHGGYEYHAIGDYFPETANECGDLHGVDKARRFSGLSAYKRVIESGIEAIVLETPPYFFPEHARAAVEAGLHVYMAKPVAADAWGCLEIEAAARLATQKGKCFLVDYQMVTDPGNLEVYNRIRAGGLGKISQMQTVGTCGIFPDPKFESTIENRLNHLIWVNDIAIGCDYIGNFDIHAIDMAIWVTGQRPATAQGVSRICRPDPHGDAHDACSVVFEYADGTVHNHFGSAAKNQVKGMLDCTLHGTSGHAILSYWGKATLKSFDDVYAAEVVNLYEAGAARNIATFYQNVLESKYTNETAQRAVDGALACILGREAAARKTRLTMTELLREKQRLEVNLKGLKV